MIQYEKSLVARQIFHAGRGRSAAELKNNFLRRIRAERSGSYEHRPFGCGSLAYKRDKNGQIIDLVDAKTGVSVRKYFL